jgi:hypothetical protein
VLRTDNWHCFVRYVELSFPAMFKVKLLHCVVLQISGNISYVRDVTIWWFIASFTQLQLLSLKHKFRAVQKSD